MVPTLDADTTKKTITTSQDDSDDDNGVAPNVPKLPDRYADESYKLFSKVIVSDPTSEEARRIRNKLVWRILPFLCIGYHLMYVDKQTVCHFPPVWYLLTETLTLCGHPVGQLSNSGHFKGRKPQR